MKYEWIFIGSNPQTTLAVAKLLDIGIDPKSIAWVLPGNTSDMALDDSMYTYLCQSPSFRLTDCPSGYHPYSFCQDQIKSQVSIFQESIKDISESQEDFTVTLKKHSIKSLRLVSFEKKSFGCLSPYYYNMRPWKTQISLSGINELNQFLVEVL